MNDLTVPDFSEAAVSGSMKQDLNSLPRNWTWVADGGAWKAVVHGIAEGRTRLSDFTFTFHFHALEKEMAAHSSVLAWRIPGMGEPDGLPSVGSHRVRHDWSDVAAAAGIKWNHKKILNPKGERAMACFGLNEFPQNSYIEIPMPKWWYWEVGPLGGD